MTIDFKIFIVKRLILNFDYVSLFVNIWFMGLACLFFFIYDICIFVINNKYMIRLLVALNFILMESNYLHIILACGNFNDIIVKYS